LTLFWVLVLGAAELFLFQAIGEMIVREPLASVVWHGLIFAVLTIVVVGVVMRQFWAYPASIILLLAIFIAMSLGFAAGTSPDDALAAAVGGDLVALLSIDLESTFFRSLLAFGEVLRYVAVILALIYGILKIGPDFERIQVRRVAMVDKGISDASRYYAVGKEYASRGMWASAVLHWQRAAANEPARAHYQRVLGEAYAHLGFYQRSVDVLKSALKLSPNPAGRAQIKRLIADVEEKAAAEALSTDRTQGN
jgi:tetratricopeptide (TPR) repeat protein